MPRLVIAIGGNSLIPDGDHQTVQDQYAAAAETDDHIAALVERGWDVAISHGNGPQVGFILRRSELASSELHEVPLDYCGADTQGAIGPKLSDFSVPGVLPDPVIELVRLGELIPMAVNDDWEDGGQAAKIVEESIRLGAFNLNAGGRDSVMSISLEPGKYTARVKGNGGLTGVGLVEVYDADNSDERLSTADVVNIATRGEVGTGGDVLIAGFVVSGDVPKRILLRGIGPQLTEFGVVGALEDPRLDLTNSDNVLVASNNDWGDNPDVPAVVSATQQVGAFPLDEGSKDSSLLIWLEPGIYSAKVSGADGGTGVALIEVYDN